MDEADRLERIAAAFAKRDVKFVIIGGWAVEAQGYELGYKTDDIDFTPDLGPENLERLSAALYDLDAKIRVDDQSLAFNHSGESLGRARVWNLTCEDGAGRPAWVRVCSLTGCGVPAVLWRCGIH